MCDGVVLVVHPDHVDDEATRIRPHTAGTPVTVVAGGASRSASVRAGLAAVPAGAGVVAVHDAARPLASPALWARMLDSVGDGSPGVDGAVPVVPVTDTLRSVGGGAVDRSTLVAVQTPQVFVATVLRDAHAGGDEATDDATLVEAAGGRVVHVEGEPTNLKITSPGDLDAARALLARLERERAGHDEVDDSDGGAHRMNATVRIGQGFDVHRRSADPARRLVLGGVEFPDEPGLEGHSDADVIAHACADALLGACGLPDIGQLFPDTDPRYAGADSLVLLGEAAAEVRRAGFEPLNVDCALVCDSPRIAPVRDEMMRRLSDAVGAPVAVKGRRTEGLGALGRGEGVAAWAVALVEHRPPGPAGDAAGGTTS